MPTNRGLGGGGGLDGSYQIPGSRLITSRLHPPGTEEEPRLFHQPLLLVLQSAYLPRGNWTYYDVLRCPHHLKREILPNGRTWSFVPRDRPLSLESAVMGFAYHSFSSSPSSPSPLSSSLSLSYWIFEKMYAKKCKWSFSFAKKQPKC